MTWQRSTAEFKDLMLDRAGRQVPVVHVQNHVGYHQRTRDRALSGSHQRHPDLWMSINHGFYFLRMDLQASDVDDAVPPAHEVIAIPAQLDQVLVSTKPPDPRRGSASGDR